MADLATDVRAYAHLAARLAAAGDRRDALLAAHGLDEDGWDALDTTWQDRLSAESGAETDGVPPLMAAFASAFAEQQRHDAEGSPVSFERFVDILRVLRRGTDVSTALERLGVDLPTVLEANRHWSKRCADDPELADRLRKMLG